MREKLRMKKGVILKYFMKAGIKDERMKLIYPVNNFLFERYNLFIHMKGFGLE